MGAKMKTLSLCLAMSIMVGGVSNAMASSETESHLQSEPNYVIDAGLDATSLTDGEMAEVRGESLIIAGLVIVGYVVGSYVAIKIGGKVVKWSWSKFKTWTSSITKTPENLLPKVPAPR